jgi:hypothetical protein
VFSFFAVPFDLRSLRSLAAMALAALGATACFAQSPTFCGNPQHTSNYPVAAQNLNRIRWTANIDLNNSGSFAHYGAPLVTQVNTVLVPVKTATDGFQVDAFDGVTGTPRYTLTSDYILPTHNWIPVYQPCVATGPAGTRLYYAGAGGTMFHIDNPDSSTPGAPVREVFYTSLANYNANASAYNGAIFVNTPITADSAGNIYFGFRVQGTAPSPLNTTQSGFARIDPSGNGLYVLAGNAAADAIIARGPHNSAPALSNDESTLYVLVKSGTSSNYGYLLGLNTTTMATRFKVFLRDPRNNNNAGVLEDGTASPMVAPDGDVYVGIFANPSNGSRGFLLRFSGDLSVSKTPGAFGWDYTPGLVPASMVPGYTGGSLYLIFAKYNNYAFADGNGVNKITLLDPNSTQLDPHSSASGLVEMREVYTVNAPTPDSQGASFPLAVREWCINAPAVNPATNSIFAPCEDGRIYRWDLTTNTLVQTVVLTPGFGEPYIPTVIGPDGTVFTLNGGTLFALGRVSGVDMTMDSSAPDLRTVIVGDSIKLTAIVASGLPSDGITPTGTVTFEALTYQGLTPVTTTIASNVPLDGVGRAVVSTSALQAGGQYLGNYFITATYSGDVNFASTVVSLHQKVHAFASTTALTSSPNPSGPGQSVNYRATVSSSGGTPTGFVTFREGNTVLGQIPLDSSGVAVLASTATPLGSHTITAVYNSDTLFAWSNGSTVQNVVAATTTTVGVSPNPAAYANPVTFTATVAPVQTGAGVPTGSVTFSEGATTLGSAPVDSTGHAAFNISTLSVGNHTVTGTFNGTSGWQSSSGNAPVLLVQETTGTGITSTPNPSQPGQNVTFTATVTATHPAAGVPVGTVVFSEGSTTLATVPLDAIGRASFGTSTLSAGSHTIKASFTGATGWLASNASMVQSVTTDTTPPTPPSGPRARPGPGLRQITMFWFPSDDPGGAVAGYEIWRSVLPEGPYSMVAFTANTFFTDNLEGSGLKRYYYLIAVDTAGNRSLPSIVFGGMSR